MRATFCGTGGGAFTAERASSGLILQHNGTAIMLDCGPGTVRSAMQLGIAPNAIAAVILSHLHGDHVLDITALIFQEWFRRWPLPVVYGPPGTASLASAMTALVASTLQAAPTTLPQTAEIDGSDERDICGFAVHSEPTPHAPDVIAAVRKLSQDGKSIVYSGDTQPNPGTLVPLSEGADLLIHECYDEQSLRQLTAGMAPEIGERVYNAIKGVHTEVREAAAIARDAGVRRLVLTHLIGDRSADTALQAQAATVFSGEIQIAHDGLVLEV